MILIDMAIKKTKKVSSKIKTDGIKYNIEPRIGYFDSGEIKVLKDFSIDGGVLVIYYVKESHCLGAAFFDEKTNELIYRTANPLFKSDNPLTKLKVELKKNILKFSFTRNKQEEEKIFTLDYVLGREKEIEYRNEIFSVKCIIKKSNTNPIISPITKNSWESYGTFNPAIISLNDTIHILYRAVGDGGSVIGYATSQDGLHIDERLPYPIYKPTGSFELRVNNNPTPDFPYWSGGVYGSWGGCEDPRIVKIDNMLYMTYTGFNGVDPPCIGFTSISVDDFLNRKWDKWQKSILISPKNQMHKNWVIFPEKINGKYAILHSITPNIQVEYLDNLEFKENPNIKSYYKQVKNKDSWDTIIKGAGTTPMKIDDGWLVFYHAISAKDPGKYRIGAMILDYKDPTKILYKSAFPIIEPDRIYENSGCSCGIVYTCGATIKGEDLILYYGGADTVVCVATCNLKEFVKQIKDNNGKI